MLLAYNKASLLSSGGYSGEGSSDAVVRVSLKRYWNKFTRYAIIVDKGNQASGHRLLSQDGSQFNQVG